MTIAPAASDFAAARTAGARIDPLAWAERHIVAIALVLTALPLLWPTVPPLIDLPNHMSRYRIGLDYATSPFFHQWFEFRWVLVGNLGVDLLVQLIAPLVGIEHATKLVVAAIPVLTVAGLALIARESHGRVPLTAAFAFIFAFNHPFNFGFVNYALAAALALIGFGLWLRLGRLGHERLRWALLLPIGFVIWVAHVAGWGMLGVMIFSASFADRRIAGAGWTRAFVSAVTACLPLLGPLLPILFWVQGGMDAGRTTFSYNVARKVALVALSLKNDDQWLDFGAVGIVWIALIVAIARPDFRFDRRLATVAAAMFTTYVLMPPDLIGSGYSDLRLAPYALALAALAYRPATDTRLARLIGIVALALLIGRTAWQGYTYWRLNTGYARQLAALDHVPLGARVFGFARVECFGDWSSDRLDHVNRMATVRRQAFSNDTWPPAASQTLRVRPAMLAGYDDFDSQKFTRPECRFHDNQSIDGSLAALPRDRFDYYWLIGISPAQWPKRPWLKQVWHGEDGALYRILPETKS